MTYMHRKMHFKPLSVIFCPQELSIRFKRKPLRRGQPLYRDNWPISNCVLCLEVLLYTFLSICIVLNTKTCNHLSLCLYFLINSITARELLHEK